MKLNFNLTIGYTLINSYHKYKFIIIPASIIIFYFVFVSPFIARWKEVNNQIRILERNISKALILLQDEDRINAVYNALAKIMEIRSVEKVDIEREITNTYNFLLKNANRLGVRILNFKPGKAKTKKDYKIIELRLNIEATMPEFVRYAYYIENSAQLIEIEQATVSASKKRGLRFMVKLRKILF